jgi:nucleoside phosphorylase/tetratricopeptide (TPR) repeat protein
LTTPSFDQADFLIITALDKEAKAVVSRLENHTTARFQERDIRTYHCGTIPIQGGDRAYRVVVVLLPSMGELAAANATTDALAHWNPQFVLMVGIAGGFAQDDLDLGDVVVADQVVGYEYGKVTDGGIKPRNRVYPASALLLDRVRNFWDESWAQQINVPRPRNAKRAASKLFVGPIASGNKVIASTKFRNQLTKRWPKLIAVEMEAEGVYAAVFDRPQIRGTLVIRGISDMADERKGDEWQEYAANAAAAFAVAFLKSGPVEVGGGDRRGLREAGRVGLIKTSLAKLPSTDPYLIGRERELAALDAAWETVIASPGGAKQSPSDSEIASSPLGSASLRSGLLAMTSAKVNALTLVAWGGVGKTALVNKWLSQMAEDNYRGAERVFGWSFYSQGAAEGRQVAADPFIAAALKWFGDPDPTAGSPWDKGERLAELIKQQRTLLVLDGLEPLQNPPPAEAGRIKDPALRSLLRELARQNPGLVVITTRLPVDDLKDFIFIASPGGAKQSPPNAEIASAQTARLAMTGSAVRIDLENLSAEAGAAYLQHLGVKGSTDELAAAANEYDGHALALTLLGKYLATVHRGDVRQRDKIARLTDERRQGAHARRVMAEYERWFAGKPELDILRLMGLFDRPAERGALEALRKDPPIPHLTSHLSHLSHEDWQYAVEDLRAARLLADEDPHDPEAVDCHPLLREHFGEQLRAGNPEAWREAHSRLYEYYKSAAKERPDTLEEMAPLFAAVAHGCLAGRHQEALDEVYWRRTQRGNEAFSVNELGAIGAELAALSGFFDPPWHKPVDGLREGDKSFVLSEAGFDLRALGRLAESAQSMLAGLETHIAQQDWKNAAIGAGNLSELYLTIGDLKQALYYAKQSVELADHSGDAFMRLVNRTALADALHQAGSFGEAEAIFREAEEMQKARQPKFPLLYSVQGFQYCDLLLSQGKYQEVQSRAGQTLEWYKQAAGAGLLDTALDHLSLGRADLMQAQTQRVSEDPLGLFSQAATHLDRAVDGLRQAGQQDELPRGLLARAELRRVTGMLEKARRDLDEAFSIATRGGMRLHEADCHLGYARLFVASGEKDKAREHVAIAKKMIDEIGYHRWDGEVRELEGHL